ncbi:UMP kinase [Serratia bockelmannii]
MNIIAIMGPTGVYYKDEPIRELHAALATMGFQLVYPKNSGDLLKLIEANARICGVIFDWDDYSLELCSEINELNEYLPLYAFINTHSTFDVSLHEMRMVLYFFEYGLNAADDIAQRIQQYTAEYIDTITPPLTKALFNYVREGKYTFCTPGHMAGTAFQKSPVGCLFYDFFGANTLKADISISVTELGSLLDHTGPHLEAEEYIARTFNAEQSYLVTNGTSTANKIVGMYSAPADRVVGDHMGMLATVMNGLAMRDALHRAYVNARLMSAIPLNGVCDNYSWAEAISLLRNNRVVIFSAGTGNPFFTTDSAACLRGIEIEADVVLKATKVDGVYSADPVKNPDATLYEQLTYQDVLERELKVMDLAAFTLARDHGLPIRVFNMNKPGALRRVVMGENEGTLISK